MKVIHITPSYYPAVKYGGPIQSVHLLNKFLIKKGCKVDVLTTNAGLSKGQRSEVSGQWNDVDGVRVRYVNFIGYEHFNFSLSFVCELRKIIANYDLVHITAIWNFPVLIGSLFAIIKKKPFVISPRGALYKESVELKKSKLKIIYFNLLMKNLVKKASAIHFTSKLDRDRFLDFVNFEHEYFIVPNGIEIEKISQLINFPRNSSKFNLFKNKRFILFLGRIHAIKGLDILLDAFSKISIEFKDLVLILAGPDNDNYSNKLLRIINSSKLAEKVYFTGILNFEEKIEFLNNATVFVLPSYSENFGMSAVEAMATGTPIVISDKVGISQDVKNYDAGLIVSTSVDHLKSTLSEIINNKDRQETISKNGKRLVQEKYDINIVVNQMINQYEQILSGR